MASIEQAIDSYSSTDASHTTLAFQDIHSHVKPHSLMTRTCYLEFDPMSKRAKLPACFTRVVGSFIRDYVVLQDQRLNKIQVSVERKNHKIYFTRGWSRLKDFYGIGLGGWVTLLYINPFLCDIKVTKITGHEVDYPIKDPPYKLMLLQHSVEISSNGPIPYFVIPKSYCHTLEKTLTTDDVESGILELPWEEFCENALPCKDAPLMFIDWHGYTWKCYLNLDSPPHTFCYIHGEWLALCRARNLAENMTIKLGVTKPSNNNAIFITISPMLGVRTTLIAPTTNGGYKAFYQSQQYFML